MSELRSIIEKYKRRDIPEHPISRLFKLFLLQQRKRDILIIWGKREVEDKHD